MARPIMLLLLLAAAGGCGGEQTLGKEQYAARLTAACAAFAAREKEIGEPRTPSDLVERGPPILAAFEETILAQVQRLEAPSDFADDATRLAELAKRQRDVLAALVDAARAGDFARVRTLSSENAAINEEAGSVARNLGATGCAPP
jgi:hypothetical protein